MSSVRPPTPTAGVSSAIPAPGQQYLCSIAYGLSESQSLVLMQLRYVPAGTVTVSAVPSTCAISSATPSEYSCLHDSPTRRFFFMMIPGSAPFFPASHDPAVLATFPCLYTFESSPKYHTSPFLS